MDRGERRARTALVAERQLELRQSRFFGFVAPPLWAGSSQDPSPWRSPHFWAKRKAMGCGCRVRVRGNPRASGGLCWMGGRDWIYELRNQTRELNVLARRGETDWESDEVEALVAIPKKA